MVPGGLGWKTTLILSFTNRNGLYIPIGIALTVDDLNNKLYDFQKDIVRWALAKGRAAIFADCGLGQDRDAA